MAIEFNITAAHHFFMGEDKVIELTIFERDAVTPFDVSSLPLEWNMRKTDKAGDPAILTRGIGTGLTIVGAFNLDPTINTQRVRITFVPADTAPTIVKPNFPYRHSLKRLDLGNANIFTFGSITFLQATER